MTCMDGPHRPLKSAINGDRMDPWSQGVCWALPAESWDRQTGMFGPDTGLMRPLRNGCKIWSISMHHSLQIMFILPLMKATSFDRPPSWVAFIEGFHCISNSIFNLSISIPFPVLEFELSCNSNFGIELTQPYMQWLGTELVTSHYPNQWWPEFVAIRCHCHQASVS